MADQPGSQDGTSEEAERRRRRRFLIWWFLGGAGALLALIVIVAVLVASGGDDDEAIVSAPTTGAATETQTSGAGAPSPSPTPTPEATLTTAVASEPPASAAATATESPTPMAASEAAPTAATATSSPPSAPPPDPPPEPPPEPPLVNAGPITVDEPIGRGLVGLWHFDGNAMDSSGFGNHGTPNGVAYGEGVFGQSLSLNGTSAFVQVPDDPSLNPTAALSVQAWYRGPFFTGVGNNALIDKGAVSHAAPFYQYHLGITGRDYLVGGTGNEVGFSFAAGGEERTFLRATTAQMTANVWHHLLFTYDGQEAALYVDGVRTNFRDVTGALPGFGDPGFSTDLFIGTFANRRTPADHMPGSVDEVAIWNRALSQAEVVELFNRGAGG